MSKTVELARHLETLRINNMYKTDDEIDAVFTVADALRDLRERNKSFVLKISLNIAINGGGYIYKKIFLFSL